MASDDDYKRKFAKELAEGKGRVFIPFGKAKREAFLEAEREHQAKKTPFERRNPFFPKSEAGKKAYLETQQKMRSNDARPFEPIKIGDVWSQVTSSKDEEGEYKQPLAVTLVTVMTTTSVFGSMVATDKSLSGHLKAGGVALASGLAAGFVLEKFLNRK